MKFKLSTLLISGLAAVLVVLAFMAVGVNDAGYRTVIQYPNGTMDVKFEPGYYFSMFGKTTEWPDFMTFDFSGKDRDCQFEKKDGIKVRYQDGGEGVICGLARVALPNNSAQMLDFHKAFRTPDGARAKLLRQAFPKALNLTAALVTSEEAYATKRAELIRMANDQAENGLYETHLVDHDVVVGINAEGKEDHQTRQIPEPLIGKDGKPVHQESDFAKYGIAIQQFDMTGWDFEQRTLDQVSQKRKAEMAIVTAQAEAKRAYFDKLKAVAEGEKDVAAAQYEEKTKAERVLVQADRDKQKAVIEAEQKVEVRKQETLEAQQSVLQETQLLKAAEIQAKRIKTLADANAYEKKTAIMADGALKQKLAAIVQMNKDNAQALADRKVPTSVTVLGGGDGKGVVGSDSDVKTFLQLQSVAAAKQLGLSMQVEKGNEQ